MKLKQIAKFLKWTAVWTATWTMLMTPVAWGQQAKNVSKQEMESMIAQLGLNRRITMGEFFERNRHLFSERVLKEVEPFFIEHRNVRMPQVEVVTVKSGLGENITTLRITDSNGQLSNVQWLGETNRMVKFQNTILSHNDIANFDDMFKQLLQQDPVLRQQAVKSHNKAEAESKFRNVNIPFPSQKEWKSMSLENRAAFMIRMRSVLNIASEINELKLNPVPKKAKPKKTSSLLLEKIEFVRSLIGSQEAIANNCPTDRKCIIAGYSSFYRVRPSDGRCSCSVPLIEAQFEQQNFSIYQKADQICKQQGSSYMACNPYLYMGDGQPICVNTAQAGQIGNATTWEGRCDNSSRLTNTEIENVVTEDRAEDRYAADNIKTNIRERALADQRARNFEDTKKYLAGTLKFIKNNELGLNSINNPEEVLNGTLNQEILNQLKLTKEIFDRQVSNARAACREGATDASAPDSQFQNACDQLHARHLLMEEFLESKCKPGQTFDRGTLMCSCTNNAPAAFPGADCGEAPPPADRRGNDRSGGDTAGATDCESRFAGLPTEEKNGRCVCPGTDREPVERVRGTGGRVGYTCNPSAEPDDNAGRGRCEGKGLFCRLWQGITTIFPYVLTFGIIYLLFKMMAPQRPGVTNPQDRCHDGSIALCDRTNCQNPDHRYNTQVGTCMCPNTCFSGVLNPNTCVCSGSGGTGGTSNTSITLDCPDTFSSVSCPVGTPFSDCIRSGCTVHCERNGSPVYDPTICSSSQVPSVTAPPSGGSSVPVDRGSGR